MSIILSRKSLLEFLEVWQNEPCLWQVDSEDFHNKDKRSIAYEKLINKLKEEVNDATLEHVKRKISSLKTAYRRETKKIQDSKRSGVGVEDIYVPKIWYYSHLSFLSTADRNAYEEGHSTLNISTESIDVAVSMFFVFNWSLILKTLYTYK